MKEEDKKVFEDKKDKKVIDEKELAKYPIEISYECNKKILEQMEKYICKISINENQATGFFCKIPFPNKDKMLPVFMTNNHVIDKEFLDKKGGKIKLDIKEEENYKKLDLNDRKKYTNEEHDVTIIEIKEKDEIKNFLELDDIIINDILKIGNKLKEYKNETLYIIQYPLNKLSTSFGILSNIFEPPQSEFYHRCCTRGGSSGSPILNLKNKLIGIHKKGKIDKEFNIGTFLNYPIKEFIDIYFGNNKNNNNNENNNKNNGNNNNNENNNNNNENKINNIKIENNINNNELLIKEFSKKYHNIENIKDELNLGRKKLGNEGLEDLCKIEFKDIKELNLVFNIIEDISCLANFKCEKLEILYLNKNKINDISVLEKVKFYKLKKLYLSNNSISNIKVLAKVKFDELEELNLSNNQISDINILGEVNFKKLLQLSLQDNNISNVKVLETKIFEKLKLLDLGTNPIQEKDKESIRKKLKSIYNNLNLVI